jgi:hypothetical protein
MAKILPVCLNPANNSPIELRGLLGYAKRLRRFLGYAKRQADFLAAPRQNLLTPLFDINIVFQGIKEHSFLEGGLVTPLAAAHYCMVICIKFKITLHSKPT